MITSNINEDKSFADDLNLERGIVSSRVALLLRSAEIKPIVLWFVQFYLYFFFFFYWSVSVGLVYKFVFAIFVENYGGGVAGDVDEGFGAGYMRWVRWGGAWFFVQAFQERVEWFFGVSFVRIYVAMGVDEHRQLTQMREASEAAVVEVLFAIHL